MRRSSDDWSEDEEPPHVSDVRQFSDAILYFAKAGRFEIHGLLDGNRRQGVLTLLKPERVTKLSLGRRLKPVMITMTPGEPAQRVFIMALVRESVTNQELADNVLRMNRRLEGLSSSEKEEVVLDLITKTRARMMPGVRYLPKDYYAKGEEMDTSAATGERDRDGHEILKSEDEIAAFVRRRDRDSREFRGRTLPSTSTHLPDPHTDSEYSGSKRKKGGQDEGDSQEKRRREKSPSIEFLDDEFPMDHGSDAPESTPIDEVDKSHKSSIASTQEEGQGKKLRLEDFQQLMTDVRKGLMELNQQLKANLAFRQAIMDTSGQSEESGSSRKYRASTIPPEETPPNLSEVEFRLKRLFPINTLTQPMMWLLGRPRVRRFLYYQILRALYTKKPPSKPDYEFVAGKALDYMMSQRLQTHMGKAGGGRNLDFSRMPMPEVFIDIIANDIAPLGRMPAPGDKSLPDFLKDKCNGVRRTKVIGSNYVLDARSVQHMAFIILHERLDFFHRHRWLFPGKDPKAWTLQHEIVKTRSLKTARGKVDDPKIDPSRDPIPDDIEASIFPNMNKGEVLKTMEEAREIEQGLQDIVLSKPRFSEDTWKLVNLIVEPSAEEVRVSEQKQLKQAETKKERNERRRQARSKKGATATETEFEVDTSDVDDYVEDEPIVLSGSRESMERQIFGALTSSSDSSTPVTIQFQDDNMVFVQPNDPPVVQDEGENVAAANPGGLVTQEVYNQAAASGLNVSDAQVTVAASQATKQSTTYSIAVANPNLVMPQEIVIRGKKTIEATVDEVLEKPPGSPKQQVELDSPKDQKPIPYIPKPKTTSQKYSDMEADILEEDLTSSSSSAGAAKTPGKNVSKGDKSKTAGTLSDIMGEISMTYSEFSTINEEQKKTPDDKESKSPKSGVSGKKDSKTTPKTSGKKRYSRKK